MTGSRAGAERPQPREETACAVCGRREYEVVSLVDRRSRPLRTVMCTGCGLIWTNPRPSIGDVNRYYAPEYRLDSRLLLSKRPPMAAWSRSFW